MTYAAQLLVPGLLDFVASSVAGARTGNVADDDRVCTLRGFVLHTHIAGREVFLDLLLLVALQL